MSTRTVRLAVILLLALWASVLFFYGLTSGQLRQTEGLRALLGAEVLRRGDWVVPTLYGEPLLTKPPGMYAAIALASWPLGSVTTATARLPSALAATFVVFVTYLVFARYLGRRAGLVAAGILPASFLWLNRVPSAEIDLVQLGWVTGAMFAFLRALEAAEQGGRSWPWWQAALVCVAGGTLTKWTAPAFFYVTIVPLLWWRGRLRLLLSGGHIAACAVGGALCLTWAWAVAAQVGWVVFRDTVLREALQRLSPAHHPRAYPWHEIITFPLGFLAANLPWSAFALLTLRRGFMDLWDEQQKKLLQLLHCWAWTNLVFWALVPGHRARHVLPAQPALAGLAALVWAAWLSGRLRWPALRLRPTGALVALLALWLGVKLAHVHWYLPSQCKGPDPQGKGAQLAAGVPPGEQLYLFGVKDEGILFYSGLAARRLSSASELPREAATCYCLLTAHEWQRWPRRAEIVRALKDEQDAPLFLVRDLGDEVVHSSLADQRARRLGGEQVSPRAAPEEN